MNDSPNGKKIWNLLLDKLQLPNIKDSYNVISEKDVVTVSRNGTAKDWVKMSIVNEKIYKKAEGPGDAEYLNSKYLVSKILLETCLKEKIFISFSDLKTILDEEVRNWIKEYIEKNSKTKKNNYIILKDSSGMGILNLKIFLETTTKERLDMAHKILNPSNISNIRTKIIERYKEDLEQLDDYRKHLKIFSLMVNIEGELTKKAKTEISTESYDVLSKWYREEYFHGAWKAVKEYVDDFSSRLSSRISYYSIGVWAALIPIIATWIWMNKDLSMIITTKIAFLVSFALIWIGMMIMDIFFSSLKPLTLIVRGKAIDRHIQLILLVLGFIGILEAISAPPNESYFNNLLVTISLLAALALIMVVRRHQEADWIVRFFPFYVAVVVGTMLWAPGDVNKILSFQLLFLLFLLLFYFNLIPFIPNTCLDLELLNSLNIHINSKQTIQMRPMDVIKSLNHFSPKVQIRQNKYIFKFDLFNINKFLIIEVNRIRSSNKLFSFIRENIYNKTIIDNIRILEKTEDYERLPQISKKKKNIHPVHLKIYKKKNASNEKIEDRLLKWINTSSPKIFDEIEKLGDSEIIEILQILMNDKVLAQSFAHAFDNLNNNNYYRWENRILDIRTGLIGGLYFMARLFFQGEVKIDPDSYRYLKHILELYNSPKNDYFEKPEIADPEISNQGGEEAYIIRISQ